MESKGDSGIGKREGVVDAFRKGAFELLAVTGTKLERNGEVSWCEVNGIIAGIQEIEWVREGVGVLMNDMYRKAMTDLGYVSSRTLWLFSNFQG